MFSEQGIQKAQSILDFASHLELVLKSEANLSAQDFPDFSAYFAALPLPRKDVSSKQRSEFGCKGVILWNKCCHFGASDHSQTALCNLSQVRAFSYLLLESAAHAKQINQPRLFKNGLKAGKSCVASGLLDLASKVLEYLASKAEKLAEAADQDDNDSSEAAQDLRARYVLLRIALAWKQDNLAVAEHFHTQLNDLQSTLRPDRLGELIDLCYEIGNDRLRQKQGSLAARWLKRGCQLLEEHSARISDMDIIELKLSMLHTYVHALLSSEDVEVGDETVKAFKALREEFPYKLPVILLQLEECTKDRAANPNAYSAELMKIVRTVHVMHANHNLILHYVHNLKTLSIVHAIKVLDAYILTRLIPHGNEEWTERTIITLTWLMTAKTEEGSQHELTEFEESFDRIHTAWGSALSAEATHGTSVLFWKQIERTLHHDLKDQAIQWCRLALHQLFSNAGDHNIGKLERKIIKCYMDLSDDLAAQETFEKMSSARREHHLSRYLRYSLCLRLGNENEVWLALASLATAHDERNRLLFAAVSEAMQHGSRIQVAHLLQRILDKYKDHLPPELDAFTLLRFTARLLITAVSESTAEDEELLHRLCDIYKTAALLTQKRHHNQRHDSKIQLQECKWFEKTGYNSAVQYLKSWPAKYLIDLLHYSGQIRYPPDAPQQAHSSKTIHEINIRYMEAILYTVQARSTTASCTAADLPKTACSGKPPPLPAEVRSTLYRNAFQKYTEMQSLLVTLQDSPVSEQEKTAAVDDATQKSIVLAPLAFEALLFIPCSSPLEQGHTMTDELSLIQILDRVIALYPPPKTYSVFADMILSASTPNADQSDSNPARHPLLSISVTVNLLAKLVNGLRSQPNYDASQGAKWIRCMIQVVLDRLEAKPADNRKRDLSTLGKLTEHALSFARSDASYPAEELQWLATTLFNMAIDMYMSASASLATSDSVPDGGKGKGGDVTSPAFWAKRAVESADALAVHAGSSNGTGRIGDGGMLARTLRERCLRFKWLS
ncbi:hypothetical protein H2200_001425 [Cladophialophora chaetospira]|uniref:Protein ZIP4 homolog n=1 Tax=Cladophialophora chaetospira TaxID=386627 RepID=A0AA38XLM0_9EURO|nr:hypothetical protein H2200_001425 [Cladophialophora chaetospira]